MRGGEEVSAYCALEFRSESRPGLCRLVVSLGKKIYSTLPLFTQVYQWVPARKIGGNPAMD